MTPTQCPKSPITLEELATDIRAITDAEGRALRFIEVADAEQDEVTAVAFTADDEPVLLRSLYGPEQGEPVTDAVEPGLDGWVEGVNYFTDGADPVSEEKILFENIPKLDADAFELKFTTATSMTSFSVAWGDEEDATYEVYRDGVLVTTTRLASFTDDGLKPGSEYTYLVRPTGLTQGDENTFQVRTLQSDAAAVMKTADDPIAKISVQPVASWFLYNTFITDEFVDWDLFQGAFGGCVGVLGDKYGGDDRGYVVPSLYNDPWTGVSHKTGARMKIDFGPNAVIEQKHVGTSHLYSASGVLKESRRASADGIVFSERSVSSNLYSVKVSHEVGNPFCNTGAIRYSVYVNTWASGVMSLNGYRHPVPAHEAYGLFMNSSGAQYWATLYQGAQGDFFCVSGLCPTQSISKTHTPS